ncbi:phenylalanine--tRNA ligase subunit beta [Candidatus Woesearchaeota archaeon]|nr:phenylalanine--tRNA ligase subunit beta [Candidatus Woesearchaeota archaeon]
MPTITLNKSVIENLVGKKLPLDKLKDRISMLGTDLEGIEGDKIHVEIFPNRPDLLSEQGFARAFAAFIGTKPGLRQYTIKKSGFKVIVDPSVSMRPYTVCALVKNLTFTDERVREIMQVQEKLATTHGRNRKKSAYGIYPADTITFPIQYIAKDPTKIKFKPLGFHQEILASEVLERHPKGREYRHITEGWKKYPFFIDAKDKVMCMLPFTNSNDTGKVDLHTKNVFIECSGIDLQNIQVALNIIVTTLADMGGEIYSLDIVYSNKTITTPSVHPTKIKLDLPYVNKRLGLQLTEKEAVKLLGRMGYGYANGFALVPAYRADILHQVDLIEDIAIAYGYENFEEIIPHVATIAEESPFDVFKNRIGQYLVGLGLLETNTYHLIDKEIQTTWMKLKVEAIELVDPVSQEYNSLRYWMIPSLLHVLRENKQHEYPQRIFESGTVFMHDKAVEETGIREVMRLCAMSTHPDADFTEAKQMLDYVFRALDLPYEVVETEHASFIPGRVGRVVAQGKNVAFVGELHPEVLQTFGLEMPVCAFELNVNEIFALLQEKEK